MDKTELAKRIREIEGLTNEERSELLGLLNSRKRYGLVWEDKPEEAEEILKTHIPVLTEVKDKEINHDTETQKNPNHILIEGDNLHALTSLCYTHEGKIDVIYIDPPYNTGNKDFVYNDSYVDTEDSYRHSKWLSFMNKRLRIAKRLLSDKGVIFISIDDNEQANLKLLCDEVLGNFDFVATIPWRKRTAKTDVPHSLSQDYEWILCYCIGDFKAGIEKETRKYYETPDFPNRPWRIHDLTKQTSSEERPNSFFTIINPKTFAEYPANPNRTWAITKETFDYYYAINRIVFPGDYDFLKITKPALRYWKSDDEKKAGELFGFTAASSDLPKEVGMTQDGTKDVTNIFGDKAFGFPKPVSLIKYLLQISTPLAKSITILDFFAGSGTTLHATMQLNAEDGGHRQCILVTNNENDICKKVTYERNKRVINGYTTPKGVAVEGLKANNLRYFRCEMKPRELSHQSKRELVMAMTDILRIKEDIYTEQTQFGSLPLNGKTRLLRYFADGDRRMLIVYDTRVLPFVIKEIGQMEGSIKIYLFADGAYPYTEDFRSVMDKVELVALPHAFSQALKHVLPQAPEETLEEPDLTEEEQAAMMEEAIEAENNEEKE